MVQPLIPAARLEKAPWRLAVNRNHSLAKRARITPEDVAKEPLLAYCRRDYPEYWEGLTNWLRAHGQRPRIVGEYDGVDSLMAAVESGLGVAVVTNHAARLISDRVRLLTLSAAPKPVCIAAAFRQDRTAYKPLAVFIEELRKAAKALA